MVANDFYTVFYHGEGKKTFTIIILNPNVYDAKHRTARRFINRTWRPNQKNLFRKGHDALPFELVHYSAVCVWSMTRTWGGARGTRRETFFSSSPSKPLPVHPFGRRTFLRRPTDPRQTDSRRFTKRNRTK